MAFLRGYGVLRERLRNREIDLYINEGLRLYDRTRQHEVAWYWWTLLSLNSGPLDRSHCVAFDPLCKVLYFVLVG